MTSMDSMISTFCAHTAHLPMCTWRGQCVEHLHGSIESWDVEARSEYMAGVQLRAQLRAQGRVMPADLVWSMV